MKRLTRNQDRFWGKGNYKGNKYIIGCDGVTSKQMVVDKLGKLEDLEEKLGFDLTKLEEANECSFYVNSRKEIHFNGDDFYGDYKPEDLNKLLKTF